MTDTPAARWRGRLERVAMALTLVATLLAGGGPTTAAAALPPAPPVAGTSPGPAYELSRFRWETASVSVYYNWEGGTCAFAGNNFSGPASNILTSVLEENLEASIEELNTQLRGGLRLQLVGPATRSELCSTSSARAIVVGVGAITSAGLAQSYSLGSTGGYSTFRAARVFIRNEGGFSCSTAPVYRDLQHTMTHELLHAIGIGHSAVTSALMTPSFTSCRTPHTLQPDDLAAIAALYPPTLPPPANTTITPAPAAGVFISAVVFSASKQALVVLGTGSFDQLEAAARAAGASGVWVQDGGGSFRVLVVGGPTFLRDQFRAAFPGGLPANIAVTLVR